MNLAELRESIGDQIGAKVNGDSAVTRMIDRWINNAQREILGKKGFTRLRKAILPCSSVANSPLLTLPQAATLISVIVDRTNNRNLKPISLQDVRYRDPGLTFTGSIPDSYAIVNFSSQVAREPSAAASLFVISDSASDGNGIVASVEGITSAGYYQKARVMLNGVTGVNVDSLITTWLHPTRFRLSGNATGNVTLREGSGAGTELACIPPGRSIPRYTQVHLSPTPSTVITYYCDLLVHVENMVDPNDEPLLPEDFHWLLECGAMKRNYLKREKLNLFKAEDHNWNVGMADLKAHLATIGGVSTGGQRENQGGRQFSQLGPNFPAGS